MLNEQWRRWEALLAELEKMLPLSVVIVNAHKRAIQHLKGGEVNERSSTVGAS